MGRRTKKIKSPEVWVLRMLGQSKGLSGAIAMMEKAWDEAGWDRWALLWLEKKLDSVFSQVRLVIQRIYPESDTVTSALLKYGTLHASKPELWWALYASCCILFLLIHGQISRCRNGRHLNPILFSQHLYWQSHHFMLWLLTISNSGEIFRWSWCPAL